MSEDFRDIIEKNIRYKLDLYYLYNFFSDSDMKSYIQKVVFTQNKDPVFSKNFKKSMNSMTLSEIIKSSFHPYHKALYLLEYKSVDIVDKIYCPQNFNIETIRLDIYYFILYKKMSFEKIVEKCIKVYKKDMIFNFLYTQKEKHIDIINLIIYNHLCWCHGKIVKIYIHINDNPLKISENLRNFLRIFFESNISKKDFLINYERAFINYLAFHNSKDDEEYVKYIEKLFKKDRNWSMLSDIILIYIKGEKWDLVEEYIYSNMDIIITKFRTSSHSVGIIYKYCWSLRNHKKQDSRWILKEHLNYIFYNQIHLRFFAREKTYYYQIFSPRYDMRFVEKRECYTCMEEFKDRDIMVVCNTCVNSMVHINCSIGKCGFCMKIFK